jgi:hypothetical protein
MSDIMLSFFLLLTVTCWWKLLHRVSPAGIVVSGLALAALLLSKMSGVIVAPMLVLLAAWRAVEPRPLAWSLGGPRVPVIGGQKLALIAVAGLLTSLIAGAALWAAFGFHFSMLANAAAPRPQFDVTWEQLLAKGGALQQTIACLRDHQLLPEAWLRGLAHTTFTLSGRYTFLNGDTMLGGTPWYFPYACLVKTPLPLFALMALGLAARFRKAHSARLSDTAEPAYPARAGFEACAPLIVLFFVYWAFALTTTINIGHRHMLPIYGPMLILAGGAAEFLFAGPMVRRGIVAALMAWLIASSLWIRPQYLAYFNAIAGGPANGYRHLVDSNVDVGQDLVRLRAWLETSASATAKQPPVFLSYFGPADPVSHGIRATRFGDNGFDARPRTFPARVGGGVYCMSVTLFQGLYTLTPGPWTRERETLYRRLLDIATSGRPTPDQATMLEHLQFARMRLGLAMREPDTRIGYSILVFRLSDDEAAQILYAPWEQRR